MIKKMSKCLIIALVPILILSGCTSSSASSKNVFQGNVEAEDIDINSKIPGKIIEIKVDEGERVEEGQIIAVIDAKDIVAKREGLIALSKAAEAGVNAAKAQHEAVKGQLSAVEATLEKAKKGARNQDINKAQANYDIMKKTYVRVKALYENGAASEAQLDEITTKLDVAEQTLDMAKEGARNEDIEAAKGQVAAVKGTLAAAESNVIASEEKYRQALAGIDEVSTYIEDASIKAPIDGILTMLNSNVGEMVSTGMNIATVTDFSDVWINLNVDETEISKFKEGNELKVTLLAYEGKEFKGTVVRINKNPDFAVKKASNENGEFDLVSYGVKVKLDNSEELFRPGMTGLVEIQE